MTLLAGFVTMAPLVLCANIAGLVGHGGINAPQWFRTMVAVAFAFGNFAVAPAMALSFVWMARRQRLRDLWSLLAILLIALVDLQFHATFPAAGHRGGEVGVGAGLWLFHSHNLLERWPLAATQLLVTLLPAFWILQRKLVKR